MGTGHALDLGPDRVITDLAGEPPHVQKAFQALFTQTEDALADEDESTEAFFLHQ
jgi:hypothetical protein